MQTWRYLLLPFSILYGAGVRFRNVLFTMGWFREQTFPVPVITVGNLKSGGTGKSPMVDFITGHLSADHKIAVLSRGYGRKSKGFLYATPDAGAVSVGDEAMQRVNRHPAWIVAVDENRRHGIQRILTDYPDIEAVILDDAFQHRYVKANCNVLLIEYAHFFRSNFLLPAGLEREPWSGRKRAHIIIVTKTPEDARKAEMKPILDRIRPTPNQHIFFASIRYEAIQPVWPDGHPSVSSVSGKNILLCTGIANPEPLIKYLEQAGNLVTPMTYPDHHNFTDRDVKHMITTFQQLPVDNRLFLTTEKDAARLRTPSFKALLENARPYYLPISVVINNNDKQRFYQIIESHVKRDPIRS
ncbi:MAG: tetraacyldisaccharide 4'-kinase [Flavobacteriales bacterium]|nr:tetraacyldisaccharide 4'-kinase [Flavobacteriales bacterium]MCB9447189.1 tetraacyldisaccharide 4'-kinase [Flavobacteriales bacterium]